MRSRLALTMASLSASSALVASSSIRMRGSPISARAIASRWRWPPDKLVEPSWIKVSYPPGSRSMNSSAPASRAAWTISSNVASGFAQRAAEQEILLQHDAEARAQKIQIDLAQIVAVDLDQPLIIAVQRLEQP